MLISMVIMVQPEQAGTLPSMLGSALHGIFFSWLRGSDPALADALHELRRKPFTVSNLFPLEKVQGGDIFMPLGDLALDPAKLYWFRVTSLHSQLTEFLTERFLRQPPLSLVVDKQFSRQGEKQIFKVVKVTIDKADHPWAGSTTWQSLAQASVFADEASKPVTERVKLIFFSPTTFRARDRLFPVPMPEQTFISLAENWNSHSPVPLDYAFGGFLVEHVGINAYNLQTDLVVLEGGKQGGKLVCFRGWCEYRNFERNSEWSGVLLTLARYAFYAGVGYKTTMGLGQTLLIG